MKSFLSDNTQTGVTNDGVNFTVYFAEDGTMRGTSRWDGGADTDIGGWTADDGQYCRQWKKWRNGGEGCYLVYATGDSFELVPVSGNAQPVTMAKAGVRPGNVAGL